MLASIGIQPSEQSNILSLAKDSIPQPPPVVKSQDKKSLKFSLGADREQSTSQREPSAAELEGGRKVVDLSDDNRLSEMVKDLYGSKRYNLIKQYILEEREGQTITLSDGKKAVVDRRDAAHIASNSNDKKVAEISNIKKIIESAVLVAEEASTKENKFEYFWYYEAMVRYEKDVFPVYVNVGRTRNDYSYHIYDITQKIRDTAHRVNDVGRPVGYALENGIPEDSISQPEPVVNSQTKKSLKFSLGADGESQTVGNLKYGGNESNQGGGFKEDKYFKSDMDKWDKREHGSYVKVGTLGETSPLCQVGMPAGVVRYDVDKLKRNMNDHADYLTINLLKEIPRILENPVAISEYKKEETTISVFGDVFVGTSPMMVGVTISHDRAGNEISKVRTYNARKDVGKLINDDTVLYLGEHKKRTLQWFQACGIQVPLGGIKFGFIRSISQKPSNVNSKDKKV